MSGETVQRTVRNVQKISDKPIESLKRISQVGAGDIRKQVSSNPIRSLNPGASGVSDFFRVGAGRKGAESIGLVKPRPPSTVGFFEGEGVSPSQLKAFKSRGSKLASESEDVSDFTPASRVLSVPGGPVSAGLIAEKGSRKEIEKLASIFTGRQSSVRANKGQPGRKATILTRRTS